MNRVRLVPSTLMFVLFTLTSALMIQAAPKTFVSAQRGNDANLCDLAGPCRTFARALTQVDVGGEVVVLDSGDYEPFTIGQSVTVQAPAGVYAGITAASGYAVTVRPASTGVVVLRGLTLKGLGGLTGIWFSAGAALHVEDCVISGFSNDGITSSAAGLLFVKDTVVRNCGRDGIGVSSSTGSAKASIDRCRLEKNGDGVTVGGNAKVTVRDSTATGGAGGFVAVTYIAGTTAELNIENCLASNNGYGVHANYSGASGTATIRISNSTVTDNNYGLAVETNGTLLSRQNNIVEGNLFADTYGPIGTFAAK